MVAIGCLIEAKGISLWQMETTQTGVITLFVPEALLNSVKEHETITTHNTNRHCRVQFSACVRQLLSKQLYIYKGCHNKKEPAY